MAYANFQQIGWFVLLKKRTESKNFWEKIFSKTNKSKNSTPFKVFTLKKIS